MSAIKIESQTYKYLCITQSPVTEQEDALLSKVCHSLFTLLLQYVLL